ncbi:MAG: P-loop NTPase [Chloroflexota bacterium]
MPTAAVVMMSVQGEADYLRRSMLAGAREFLVKPFSADELCAAIRGSTRGSARSSAGWSSAQPQRTSAVALPVEREAGKVITLFAPKGGVGRTTLAVNLAVAIAADQGRSVALMDASFQFGDVGVLLNLNPATSPSSTSWARAAGSPSTWTTRSSATAPGSRCCSPRRAPRWRSS